MFYDKTTLFKVKDNYSNNYRCPNICGFYGIMILCNILIMLIFKRSEAELSDVIIFP